MGWGGGKATMNDVGGERTLAVTLFAHIGNSLCKSILPFSPTQDTHINMYYA